MDYLERSNYLFKTSRRYKSLLDSINANIKSQNEIDPYKNCFSYCDIGAVVWGDLK